MRVTKFARKGQYHKAVNAENQDEVYSYENADFCYISIADGASSCKYGKQGAKIACECIKTLLQNSDIFDFQPDKIAYIIWEEIMFHIKKEARKQNISPEMFASTYIFAYLEKRTQRLLTYNLGDGAVFVKYDTEDIYKILSAPKRQDGNCTLIPNEKAYKKAEVKFNDFFKGSVLLCTDGFYNILLNNDTTVENMVKKIDCFNSLDDVSFITLENYEEVNKF